MQDQQQVRARVESLASISMGDLKQMWWTLYGTKTPKFNRVYLERHLAYRLQEISYGGLSERATETLRLLRARKPIFPKRQIIKPPAGVILIKQYRGVEHSVKVLIDGFNYQGKKYKSLSAIALKISGTHWNGLKFFGLRRD
ncbi:MAG: DUF2924 domain-containing protein [Alphaproteobacteria bacterium]|nr:DUF2924 domain-containing protein [Alphaproteobacteria bacterium]